MPAIAPSRLLHYAVGGDLSRLVAPPYDVLDEAARAALEAADPHNIVRLTLPREAPGEAPAERYRRGRALLDAWRADGVLAADRAPSLLLVTQEFEDPRTGERRVRRGLQALLRLSEFSEGVIHPHERTLSAPKADRLELLQAAGAHLSPIFVLFPDDANEVLAPVLDLLGTPPDFTAAAAGVTHRAWRITNPQQIRGIQERIAQRPGYIADGHHRYETALAHRAGLRAAGAVVAGTAADHIPAFLCSLGDPGLVILPTHRVLHGAVPLDGAREKAQRFFTETKVAEELSTPTGRTAALALLAAAPGPGFLVVDRGGGGVLMQLREDAPLDEVRSLPALPALRRLDVVLLHAVLLEHVVGLSREAQERGEHLRYVKDAHEALRAPPEGQGELAFVLNPTPMTAVRAVADAGEVMPQKSTFFFPKLVDGFGIAPLDGEVA